MMKSVAVRGFALLAYGLFLATFVYFIGFVSGWGVPRSVDEGVASAPAAAVAVDVALVVLFGLAHSVMARAGAKRLWTRLVPPAAERSLYVLVATLQIALLCWQWRPLPTPRLWSTTGAAALALTALESAGWATLLISTFLIDHFELFGLRDAFAHARPAVRFRTPLLYRVVRHPMYLGMLLALWSAPVMTAGHCLLAGLLTGYLLVGVRHEERDLVRAFGEDYRRYQAQVPMLLPLPSLAKLMGRRPRSVSS
jgi:protein-S-isoprenylcysteine O-methyltransferase Ste14